MDYDDLAAHWLVKRALEMGTLTAVAREQRMAKTVLGRLLARAEDILGVTLIQRSTRRLSLTAAGQVYLDRYATLVAGLQAARREVAKATVAAAAPAAPAARPAGAAPDHGPERFDLVLRRLPSGQWACVAFPGEIICVGLTVDDVLSRMASTLTRP
jgi:DNA-binding transcriptional LysR family regulator